MHLGRPLHAYRAWLGWRTSWLSREVLAFGAYVPLVMAAAVVAWLPAGWLSPIAIAAIELLGIASGIGAIYCSAMIYIATRRGCWNSTTTFRRFAMTTFMLGNATCTAVGAAIVAWQGGRTVWDYRYPLLTMAIAAVVTIARAAMLNRWLRAARSHADIGLRGSACLLTTDLWPVLFGQLMTAAVAAFILPVLVLAVIAVDPLEASTFIVAICGFRLLVAVATEVTERYLFFASSVSTRMPGAPLQ